MAMADPADTPSPEWPVCDDVGCLPRPLRRRTGWPRCRSRYRTSDLGSLLRTGLPELHTQCAARTRSSSISASTYTCVRVRCCPQPQGPLAVHRRGQSGRPHPASAPWPRGDIQARLWHDTREASHRLGPAGLTARKRDAGTPHLSPASYPPSAREPRPSAHNGSRRGGRDGCAAAGGGRRRPDGRAAVATLAAGRAHGASGQDGVRRRSGTGVSAPAHRARATGARCGLQSLNSGRSEGTAIIVVHRMQWCWPRMGHRYMYTSTHALSVTWEATRSHAIWTCWHNLTTQSQSSPVKKPYH
eukprot:351652-Chlamydomonas_euryale.AAC.10